MAQGGPYTSIISVKTVNSTEINASEQKNNIAAVSQNSKQKDTEMIEQLKLDKDVLSKLLKEEREKKSTDKSIEIQTMVEAKNKEIQTMVEAKNKEIQTMVETKNNEIQELQNVITELRQETERLRTSKQKDMEIIEQLKLKQDELSKLLKEEREKKPTNTSTEIQIMVEAKNNEIRELQNVTTELRQETERLRTSLSKAAGAKLTEGNPGIADLSDPNRPQKLCEQFNNLYDNLWTDAFDHLLRTVSGERLVCEDLVTIFKKCWEFCCDCAVRQLEDLQDHLLHPAIQIGSTNKQGLTETLSSLEIKSIDEARKCLSRHSLQNIKQFYWKNKANQQEPLHEYVNACLDICWYAAINNPKLDFMFDPKKNKADFRAYTKSGKYVDYLVWPAMYLYVNGPLLYKGVVQLQDAEREQM